MREKCNSATGANTLLSQLLDLLYSSSPFNSLLRPSHFRHIVHEVDKSQDLANIDLVLLAEDLLHRFRQVAKYANDLQTENLLFREDAAKRSAVLTQRAQGEVAGGEFARTRGGVTVREAQRAILAENHEAYQLAVQGPSIDPPQPQQAQGTQRRSRRLAREAPEFESSDSSEIDDSESD